MSVYTIGGSPSLVADPGFEQHRHGDRSAGLLHISGVGHHASTGGAEREVLQLLRGAVPGHNLQHNAAPQDALLYRELDHPVRRHLVPVHSRVLSALRLGRESVAVHLHPALAHRVLPAAGGDHSADFHYRASAGQILAVHYAAVHAVRRDHHRRAERQLPVAGHAQASAVGQALLYQRASKVSFHRAPEEGGRRQQGPGQRPHRRHPHADARQVQVVRKILVRQLRSWTSAAVAVRRRRFRRVRALFRGTPVPGSAHFRRRRGALQPSQLQDDGRKQRHQPHFRQDVCTRHGEDMCGLQVYCSTRQEQRFVRKRKNFYTRKQRVYL